MDKHKRKAVEKGKNSEPGKSRTAKAAAATAADKKVTPVAQVEAPEQTEDYKEKVQKALAEGKLPPLPRLPGVNSGRKKAPKKKVYRECTCGCGGQTQGQWVPGHDARAKGWAMRVERDICKITDIPVNERKGAQYILDARKGLVAPSMKVIKGNKAAPAAPAAQAEPAGAALPTGTEGE